MVLFMVNSLLGKNIFEVVLSTLLIIHDFVYKVNDFVYNFVKKYIVSLTQ